MGILSFFKSLGNQSDNDIQQPDRQEPENNTGAENTENKTDGKEENKTDGKENTEKSAAETNGTDGAKGEVNATYNLIILDESGSMNGVREQTVSGCNETLNGIRSAAKDNPEIKQYVSIYCFDSSHPRYLFKNMPIEEVRDLTYEDYCPNACTPLYDAVGYTVTELKKALESTPDTGKVTIITDGMENASRRWTHGAVVELIASLKKQGWLFTFIGANIDVEGTAKGLGISSYLRFKQTNEGMSKMWATEQRSQRAYNKKMIRLKKRGMMRDERMKLQMMSDMNDNYFVEEQRVAPDHIKHLTPDGVLVFGSDIKGTHNGGAARYAVEHFGAIVGQAEGLQGQSYAIPTAGCTFDELKEAVERFTDFVVMNPDKKFMLTAVGCGAAGYTVEQVAPLFREAYSFGNVYVPASFLPYVDDVNL